MIEAILRRYARGQARDLAPHLEGRVLDLGAGEGFVAERIGAVAVDIGRFRRARVPYVVYDGARLPFRDGTFDTTVILLALHHCRQPEAVVAEAMRVTRRRMIVTESVYRTRRERWWLDHLDHRLNRRRHGGAMEGPFGFRRPAEWVEWFGARGLTVRQQRWLGSRWERLVHHPLLFVLEAAARSGARQV